MTWSDRARQLTLEPGAPAGSTNLAVTRPFKVVVLPEGTSKEVTYSGRRVQVSF
jgi:hypothetical protein